MSYTFAATGLPPGLSLLGSQILGTPSTPGNYTVTVTVSDGVSSVSETVNVTIDPVVVPLPFWQLILSAESGCYASESLALRFLATADTGSYWQDDAGIKPAPPIVTVEAGSYWRESAIAATADTGSYWRESATVRPIVTVASGSYWRDRAYERLQLTADAGSYWRDSVMSGSGGDAAYVAATLPHVPATQRQTVANAAFAAASALANGTTQYDIIDTLAARVYNWLCFLPGAIYTDTAGTTIATSGASVARVDPWIGSLKAQVYDSTTQPVLTANTGVTFNGFDSYLVMDTADYTLPAYYAVARKTEAVSDTNAGIFALRTSNIIKSGIAVSNETSLLFSVGYSSGSIAATNNWGIYTSAGYATAGEVNGNPVNLTNLQTYDVGVEIPNATGFNLYYAATPSASGSKTAAIGADSFSAGSNQRVWRGEIADLIWLNAIPSSTEKSRLTAFFKSLWYVA